VGAPVLVLDADADDGGDSSVYADFARRIEESLLSARPGLDARLFAEHALAAAAAAKPARGGGSAVAEYALAGAAAAKPGDGGGDHVAASDGSDVNEERPRTPDTAESIGRSSSRTQLTPTPAPSARHEAKHSAVPPAMGALSEAGASFF
jgi:hypothetical protein